MLSVTVTVIGYSPAAATEPAPTAAVVDYSDYELLKYKYDLLKEAHDQLLAKETVPKSDYDELSQNYKDLQEKLLELTFSAENEATDSAAYNALKQKLENAEKSAERLRKTVLELRKERKELQSRVKELEGRVEELEKQLGIDPESLENPGE